MKKVLLIITCLLCVLCVSAGPIHVSASMNYSSTYKGSGRSGMIYTTSSARMTSIGGGGSMAQAPVASMGSTSSSMGRGITTSTVTSAPQISGIYTSASVIRGGVTTYGGGCHYGPRRGPGQPDPSVDPNEGEHNWVQNPDGTYTCTLCWITITEEEFYNLEFSEHCVPVGDGWQVWLFLTILACAYALYKVRARKSIEE